MSASSGMFVDPINNDLHLRSTAVLAIDAAPAHPDVTDDYDGQRRPTAGAAPRDLGADEFFSIGAIGTPELQSNFADYLTRGKTGKASGSFFALLHDFSLLGEMEANTRLRNISPFALLRGILFLTRDPFDAGQAWGASSPAGRGRRDYRHEAKGCPSG